MYKKIDLFGQETTHLISRTAKRKNLFSDHDAFVEKFEVKKTTDDCYTPPAVYDTVLNYVRENFDLTGKEIIRPFYPGSDYEYIEYPENGVVIDNPPFSIISKICRFYVDRQIPYFLFAPHLTLFSSDLDHTHIVVGASIIYENGACVKTSYLSNMFGQTKVIGEPGLYEAINAAQKDNTPQLPKYEYPNHVLTVSMVQFMVERGIPIKIDKKDVKFCRGLAAQRVHKKAIFGSGFLLSDKAAADKAAADKAAAEKAASEKDDVMFWELSKKEWAIIKALG